MKCKQLGLRVLSTAAIMSIVTSIATSAFAGVYYINEGDIDVSVDENGNVKVTQTVNGVKNEYEDKNGEVIIRGGTAADYTDGRTDKGYKKEESATETTTIGESEPVTPEQETEETPTEEEPVAEEEQPEETAETAEEPTAEEVTPAEEEEPEKETSEEETEEAETPVAPQEEASAETPVENETETTEREIPDTTMDGMTVDETTGKMSGYHVASGPKSQMQTNEDGTAKDIASTGNTISIRNDWAGAVKEAFKFILENVNIKTKKATRRRCLLQAEVTPP